MRFEHQVSVSASPLTVWGLLMDIPVVGLCIPGVESVEPVDEDRFRGAMLMKIGAIRLRFEGTIIVTERNRESWRARMEIQGADRRIGGSVNAKIEMQLKEISERLVQLTVQTEAAIMGKLGELGQAVIRKKADQVMTGFAENIAARVKDDATGSGSSTDEVVATSDLAPEPAS